MSATCNELSFCLRWIFKLWLGAIQFCFWLVLLFVSLTENQINKLVKSRNWKLKLHQPTPKENNGAEGKEKNIQKLLKNNNNRKITLIPFWSHFCVPFSSRCYCLSHLRTKHSLIHFFRPSNMNDKESKNRCTVVSVNVMYAFE